MQTILLILFLQIVLESLPVSSSGHLFIIKKFLSISFSQKALALLDHFAHGPTLLILLLVFWRELRDLFLGLFRFEWTKNSYNKFISIFLKILCLVGVVEIITVLFYGLFNVLLVDCWLLGSDFILCGGLLVTGVGLLSLYWLPTHDRYESWDMRKALVLGLVQGLALLPGISRFGATYVVGRWLSLSPRRALQISFLIYVPLVTVAFLRAGSKLVLGATSEVVLLQSLLFSWRGALVLTFATIGGYLALRWARQWVCDNKFWRFGVYVLALGILFLVQWVR